MTDTPPESPRSSVPTPEERAAIRAAVTDRMPPLPTPASDVTVTVTDVNVTDIKPKPRVLLVSGWRTSEFWLKVSAFVLTAVYASGAITNNTVLALAGMAATILGALGYTVSRTLLKAAA